MVATEKERRQAPLLGAIPIAVSEWRPLEVSPAQSVGPGTAALLWLHPRLGTGDGLRKRGCW